MNKVPTPDMEPQNDISQMKQIVVNEKFLGFFSRPTEPII
jgi:hypothetical protein